MAHNDFAVFVETSVFTRKVQELFPEEEYRLLQVALLRMPDIGVVIPGSGGIRKLRWGASGRGKRGGARIIYYRYVQGDIFYMLLAYPKNERDDLTVDQVKTLRRLVREEFG
jgi:hypothetical protein